MASRASVTGNQRARDLAIRLGRELRLARATAGLSQQAVARRALVSQATVSAIERGAQLSGVAGACRIASACGMDLSVRLFPASGVGLRDSGQVALAEAIVRRSASVWHPVLEAPLGTGDRRAVDLVLTGPREIIAVEIERTIVDFQAQLRAAQLKREQLQRGTDLPVRLILAFRHSVATRRILVQHRGLIERALPAAGRRIWSALSTGGELGSDGVLLLADAAGKKPRRDFREPADRR